MCCVVLASGCIDDDAAEKAECEEQGGAWDYVGLSLDKMCNLPTADDGTECNNSAECEGDCIADLSTEEMDVASSGGVVETSGMCTSWKLTIGCLPYVEDGKVENIICVD